MKGNHRKNNNHVITLSDGRQLAYAEWGDPSGFPVIGLHGTPGSRIWFMDDDETAQSLGIRLITVDRPGYGGSDPKKGRGIADFSDDLLELVEQLKLTELSIFGVSGGGPFALAAGINRNLPLHKIGLVASMSELKNGKPPKDMCRPNRWAIAMSKYVPWLLRFNFSQQKKWMEKKPDLYMQSTRNNVGHLCPSDQEILRQNEAKQTLLLQMKEALAQGPGEPVHELRLLSRKWDFGLEGIMIPVHIWHGTDDTLSPVTGIEHMIPSIRNNTTYFIRGKGHFLDEDEAIWEDILKTLKDSGHR